jgi:ABC-2 type transport system permease protein
VETIRDSRDGPPPRAGWGTIDVRSRGWFNPTLNYKHYMVPGLLVSLTTIIGTLLTAQNIAREKELGTLEQLNVTPITRTQFIAGKLLPFWILALVTFSLGLGIGKLVFGIPMRGSLVLVYFSAAVYLVVALGIGLWISTIAHTQQQTLFVSFFIMMIYLLMSGLFTPIESMPTWAKWAAELNPVKHFVVIMRAVLVKGADLEAVSRPLGILAVYGAPALEDQRVVATVAQSLAGIGMSHARVKRLSTGHEC